MARKEKATRKLLSKKPAEKMVENIVEFSTNHVTPAPPEQALM